ncbi:hypothetical protein FB33_0906, partial [Cutibacterium acnes]
MVLASAIFGPAVIRGGGWPMWMPMAVFFVESVLFTAMTGGSFGQIVARVAGAPPPRPPPRGGGGGGRPGPPQKP